MPSALTSTWKYGEIVMGKFCTQCRVSGTAPARRFFNFSRGELTSLPDRVGSPTLASTSLSSSFAKTALNGSSRRRLRMDFQIADLMQPGGPWRRQATRRPCCCEQRIWGTRRAESNTRFIHQKLREAASCHLSRLPRPWRFHGRAANIDTSGTQENRRVTTYWTKIIGAQLCAFCANTFGPIIPEPDRPNFRGTE